MSAGDDANDGRPFLRVAVPGIDADRLEATVVAKRSRYAAAVSSRTRSARSGDDDYLQTVFADIESRLDLADARSLPRTQIPKRLARLSRFAPLVLRPYNYLMKPQREAAFEQTQALRAMLAVLRAMANNPRD